MADPGSFSLGPRLDIDQLLSEAQHRWLRPAEICEILRNYLKFQIASEPANRPPSGSLFLFDRKVLRYFRKDGHNWRKKRDGKTVKEAHEKLKVGSVDVLHCYYAHGEDNENFQRRSYWMLEQELMHIVFVHYLEVKGNRTSGGGIRESNDILSSSTRGTSANTDSASPTSTLTSLCEEADSGDSHQMSFGMHAYPEPQVGNGDLSEKKDSGNLGSLSTHSVAGNHGGWTSVPGFNNISHVHGNRPRESESQSVVELPSWEDVYEHSMAGYHNVLPTSSQPGSSVVMENMDEGNLPTGETVIRDQFGNSFPIQSNWQIPLEENPLQMPNLSMRLFPNPEVAYDLHMRQLEQRMQEDNLQNELESLCGNLGNQINNLARDDLQLQHRNGEPQCPPGSNSEGDIYVERNMLHSFPFKKSLLDREESLKKVDSFSRWISKELGDVDDLQMQSSSGISWSSLECGTVDSSLSPSLSRDQLFSIVEISPNWAYIESEIEVLIIGSFLTSKQEVIKCSWSCMFGEVEVPAEILVDGVLCCYAPPHTVGHVPFYVTCSNRLACSEVREFDYRHGSAKDVNTDDIYGRSTNEVLFNLQLERLLSHRSVGPKNQIFEGVREKRNLISKIILLKEEEEVHQHEATEQHHQDLVKEKLYSWLIHKVTEDGKGPNLLDNEGQGMLHLVSALGYDWAIRPILAAGVSINFRDVNGWTALHWAAFCGREQTVAVLVSLGAAPGALTDPSPEFPLGRTPADLASGNGNKGISGFLAESSLTSYLESLTMNSSERGSPETSGAKVVQTVSERTATPLSDGVVADALSLKDSLTAVCNATQAADRIHQVFRMQSFQRKQLTRYDENDDELGVSDEHALSYAAAKTRKPHRNGMAHIAAVQIQKKFRGWKKRKEFLLIRQRIVKIQAHVRGHQVRKQYKAITWSVGILEKIILRWRRKRSGLRNFRPDVIADNTKTESTPSNDDDYDFLKKGRKQTEQRLEKALTRVKSMVQYPEARAQYRRLLTVVEGYREPKGSDMVYQSTEQIVEGDEFDDLIDLDSLLDDDAFMSMTYD